MSVDFETERKIKVNHWIINARWLYMGGILLIGVLTKTISESDLNFSMVEMVSILLGFVAINFIFLLTIKKIEKRKEKSGQVNTKLLLLLSCSQITAELVAYTVVMHKAGGIESMSSVFFFLPIVSASLLIGLPGSITTAIISGILINGLVISEYFNIIPHIPRYKENTFEFTNLGIGLTKTITTSIFYIIIGIFSGYGARILFRREAMLKDQTQKLDEESGLRDQELKKLDETTQLLTKREQELSEKNWILDAKIKELEASKNSLTNALNDVKQERIKSEEEKNKSMAIISNFNDPIIVLDKENKLTLFNEAAKVSLGLKNTDLGTLVKLTEDYSLENFRPLIRKVFAFKKLNSEKENSLVTEEMRINDRGKETIFKVVTIRIKDSWDNYTGVMKLFYDITRERMIDQMKSDFISIAAHQLRTPLSAIKWSTGMMLNGDVGQLNIEQENLLRKSYVSNEAMINLVNDLLNVSRIEEGRFGYIFKNITLQEVIDTVIANVKPEIDKAGIHLSIENQEKHTQVCMDKEKMVLAMQNLLENAIKYTPRYGKIVISVKRAGDEQLMLSIKDSGVGIPKKEQDKIFSKFFRGSNVVLMETEGTGLGLFIVKNIIERHGGNIILNSEENKGTEVTLTLPIECKV